MNKSYHPKRYTDVDLNAIISVIGNSPKYEPSNHLLVLRRLISISTEKNITLMSAAIDYGLMEKDNVQTI